MEIRDYSTVFTLFPNYSFLKNTGYFIIVLCWGQQTMVYYYLCLYGPQIKNSFYILKRWV